MPTANDPLAQLHDTLQAIPASDVRAPNLPMAVFNQQGHDVVTCLEHNVEAGTALERVGLPKEVLTKLPVAIGASQAAESTWQAVRSPRRPEDLLALEQRADGVRDNVMAACRWNLRGDRIAQGTLDAIAEGKGSADLAQDLDSLGVLVTQQQPAFKKDQTFDAKARAKECHDVANELRDALSGTRADLTRQEAKDLRDRAYTYADDLLDQIRESARYAFRDEPELAARFQDRHALRISRSYYRRHAAAAPVLPVDA